MFQAEFSINFPFIELTPLAHNFSPIPSNKCTPGFSPEETYFNMNIIFATIRLITLPYYHNGLLFSG